MTDERYPKSPNEACQGLLYFPRMLDKIRLKAEGALPDAYHANLGRAMDGWTCSFLKIDYKAMAAQVAKGLGDEEVLEWCYAHGRRPDEFDINVFNEFMRKKGFRDEMTERLAWRKGESQASDRDDIQTFFDYLDFDEGRM